MEHKIGEKFNFDYQYYDWHIDIELEVVKAEYDLCAGCYFDGKIFSCIFLRDIIGPCSPRKRRDLKHVIFKRVDSNPNQTK